MECLNNYGLYPRLEGWGFTPRDDNDSDFQDLPYKTKSWAIGFIEDQNFIKCQLEGILGEFYGNCCCADKSRFLISAFFQEHFLNKEVSFNKNDYQYSFQIPKTCTKKSWMDLVLGIMLLKNGFHQSYIDAVIAIKEEHNAKISSRDYVISEIKTELEILVKHDLDNTLNLVPDDRFPDKEQFCLEILLNKALITNIYRLFLQNEDLRVIKNEILKIETNLEFPIQPRMTNGEYWELRDLQEQGKIYHPFLDEFCKYKYVYKLKNRLLENLAKIEKSNHPAPLEFHTTFIDNIEDLLA
jgi:hypothetical protein